MVVCDTDKAVLSVFFGNLKHEWQVVARDEAYCKQLIDREALFWTWVKDGITPMELLPIQAPVRPAEYRTVDMTGNNEFASHWNQGHARS